MPTTNFADACERAARDCERVEGRDYESAIPSPEDSARAAAFRALAAKIRAYTAAWDAGGSSATKELNELLILILHGYTTDPGAPMPTEPNDDPMMTILINNEPANPWRYKHDPAYDRYPGEPNDGDTFAAPLSELVAKGYGRPGIDHERAAAVAKDLWRSGLGSTAVRRLVGQVLALLPEDVAHGCFGSSLQDGKTGWEELDGRQALITPGHGAPQFRVDAVLRAAGVVT